MRITQAGLPESIEQEEAGGSYSPLITNVDYAPNGLVAYEVGTDGLYLRNTYDPAHLYRLARKTVGRIYPDDYQIPGEEERAP